MQDENRTDTLCILCGLEEDCDCTLDDLKRCNNPECLVQDSGWCSCHPQEESE